MKTVITGGAGFIGSHLSEHLIAIGHDVIVIDNLSSGKRENVPDGAQLVHADVRDSSALQHAFEGAEAIFHLAAIASVALCEEQMHETHTVNLGGTLSVIDAAQKAAPRAAVIYASSAAIYGDVGTLPISESSEKKPASIYGMDKLQGEAYLEFACRSNGMKAAAMRFFNVYGPRQDPNSPYSGVVSIFANKVIASESVTIFGTGEQTRDFINVRDVVAALISAANLMNTSKASRFEAFNVCTQSSTSVNDLYAVLSASEPRILEPTHREARSGDILHSLGDNSKAKNELSFSPRVSLADGLDELKQWMRE